MYPIREPRGTPPAVLPPPPDLGADETDETPGTALDRSGEPLEFDPDNTPVRQPDPRQPMPVLGTSVAPGTTSPAAPGDYTFGYSAPLSGSGTPTHSELLIWLAQYTSHMGGLQRDLMLGTEERNKLVEDLSFLKSQVRKGGGENGTDDWVKAIGAQAEALLAAYEGTPYYDELAKVLSGVIGGAGDGEFTEDEASKIQGELQSMIDALQKDDQIAMIQLQDVVGTVGNKIQSVSQVIAAANQTMMSVVGNIGR